MHFFVVHNCLSQKDKNLGFPEKVSFADVKTEG